MRSLACSMSCHLKTYTTVSVNIRLSKYAPASGQCVDKNHEILPVDVVSNREACTADKGEWGNTTMNFDNVIEAYASLLEVATFKGWIRIIQGAVDSQVSHSVYSIHTHFPHPRLSTTFTIDSFFVSLFFHFRVFLILFVCVYECCMSVTTALLLKWFFIFPQFV